MKASILNPSLSEPGEPLVQPYDAAQVAAAPSWESGLAALRRRLAVDKDGGAAAVNADEAEVAAPAPLPVATSVEALVIEEPVAANTSAAATAAPAAAEPKGRFGDSELDAAYREYLHRAVAQHNEAAAAEADALVLIEEDFIQAQQALQSEYRRKTAQELHTLVLGSDGSLTPAPEPSAAVRAALPEAVLHVYALPDIPSARRIRVISEQELLEQLRVKLKQHFQQAVAGMVKRAVLRKTATLSHELQMLLQEETERLVEDIVDHNLAAAMRSVYQRAHKP